MDNKENRENREAIDGYKQILLQVVRGEGTYGASSQQEKVMAAEVYINALRAFGVDVPCDPRRDWEGLTRIAVRLSLS